MNLFKLSWRNIIHRPLSSGLSVLLLASGIAIILTTLLTTSQLEDKFKENVKDVDFVVGANGSRLQLMLCNIFQVDNPTGNIQYSEYKSIDNYPLVEQAIPISMGDNYQTYRIVGTTEEYIELFNGEIIEGKLWDEPLQAVIGSGIASKLNLSIGSKFYGGHGLGQSTHIHKDLSYEVVGILGQNGTVLDNLLLVDIQTAWIVHAGEEHEAKGSTEVRPLKEGEKVMTIEEFMYQDSIDNIETPQGEELELTEIKPKVDSAALKKLLARQKLIAQAKAGKKEPAIIYDSKYDSILSTIPDEDRQVTGVLVAVLKGSAKSKLSVSNHLNKMKSVMMADVSIELVKLEELMSPATGVMELLAIVIMIIAAVSMFIAMFNSLKDRQYEVALMRIMGGSSRTVFATIIIEGIYLSVLGFLLGWLLSHFGMQIFAGHLSEAYHFDFKGWIFLDTEIYLFIGALCIGIVSALYPAYKAYSIDLSKTLSK
jgi:putative ABC transport system permease protein